MTNYQKEIKEFCKERNWDQFHNPKDLLLGIVEEIGELRNVIKWEQDPGVIKRVLLENKNAIKDAVGDMLWFISILANSCDVNVDEAIQATIEDNRQRFPVAKTKDKHTNLYLGGHDGKY